MPAFVSERPNSCWISSRRGRDKISANANIGHLKMPTTSAAELEHVSENVNEAEARPRRALARLASRPFARELLIFAAFCAFTAVMTWPWVLHPCGTRSATGPGH